MPQHKLLPMLCDHFLARLCRIAPLAVILLAGCHRVPAPPSVDAAALRRAEIVDFQTLRLPISLLSAHGAAANFCLDEHGTRPGLDYNAVLLQPWSRVAMQVGLFHPTRGWRLPEKPATHVDPTLEARLEGASATAILKLTSSEGRHQAHERARQERARPVAEPACTRRYRLSAPTYSEGIAFIDRSYSCGLCGEGATLAMDYREKQWRLIAIRPSWIA